MAEFIQVHRRAVAVADYDRPECRRVEQLPIGLHGELAILAVERAGGQVDVGLGNGLLDFVDADAARSELVRVDLHAHRIFLLAVDTDLGDAADG